MVLVADLSQEAEETIINVYNRPREERPSPTFAVSTRMTEAKAAGQDVIDLSVGELSSPPTQDQRSNWRAQRLEKHDLAPDDVHYQLAQDTGKKHLLKYGPGQGNKGLRTIAAETFVQDTGIEVKECNVVISTGAKGVLAGVIGTLHGPEFVAAEVEGFFRISKEADKIIMFSPGWSNNFDLPNADVAIVEVNTQNRGVPTAKMVKDVLEAYPDAKQMLLNIPSNPTGVDISAQEREEIFAVIREHVKTHPNLLVVNDDPYGKLSFAENPSQVRGENEKALFESGNIAVVKSFSKEYAIPGARVGYIISKNTDVLKHVINHNNNKGTTASNKTQNTAHEVMLHGGDEFIREKIEELRPARDLLITKIDQTVGVTISAPEATIYGFADFSGWKGTIPADSDKPIKTPQDLHKYLETGLGVYMVPGTDFYAPGSPEASDCWSMRIGFAGDIKELEKALDRIQIASEQLKNPHDRINGGTDGQVLAR